jgi:hypothetical protein
MRRQQQKNLVNKMKKENRKGQEELVGFGLILILVAIVFLVFISIYVKKPTESVTDYESNSFVQAILQYTTTCQEDNLKNLTIQELISKCKEGLSNCYSANSIVIKPCNVLNTTIGKIANESWRVVPNSTIKGYSFIINASGGDRKSVV